MQIDADLNQLLNDIDELAVLGDGRIEGGFNAEALLATYLIRCRDVLRAVRVLVAADLHRAADPLVRSALEYAATCGWLMKAPEESYQRLVAHLRKQLRSVLNEYAGEASVEVPEDTRRFLDEGPEDDLPSVRDRAKQAGLLDWYVTYRSLSATTHGTLIAPLMGGQVRYEGRMVETSNPLLALLITAIMTFHVGVLAIGRFGWGRGEAIASIFGRLQAQIANYRGPFDGVLRRVPSPGEGGPRA